MDIATLVQARGIQFSWYALTDRGDGTAAVSALVITDDINATGIQALIDAHAGTIPGAIVAGTRPLEDEFGVFFPNHQALIWLPPDDGAAGPLQGAAVAFLEQGTTTNPPRWVLSDKERQLVGLPPLP